MGAEKPGHKDPTAAEAAGRLDFNDVASKMRARAVLRQLRDAERNELLRRRRAAQSGGDAR